MEIEITEGKVATESEFQLGSSYAFQEAKDQNCKVVLPSEYDLQIDIDSEADFKVYTKHKEIFLKHYGIVQETVAPSKSGQPGKQHITLTLKSPVTPLERIALQACLGSDRKRELLSLSRIKINDPHPTLFLEKK